jgi:hypothetical protein
MNVLIINDDLPFSLAMNNMSHIKGQYLACYQYFISKA